MSTYCVPVRAVSCCNSVSDLRHRSHDCAVGDVLCTLTNRTGSAPMSKRMVPAGMAEALEHRVVVGRIEIAHEHVLCAGARGQLLQLSE